ncbi:DUF433 domain-containing protein [Phytohabitans sp. ZYX-F-186]|uniref:DUF433 domain-containing protein n=1 Tax=Phytohabitans maris TaxID=3071409 RepID=A0ABU0ZI03_9ACTN|nr:DUF433 domain-containing protein [Phytohabitans sp. ZYX-F-186]MDQ7906625.1 DUF433 domain-containing protein [Phytohabitans sp. ZYX-F-186]
MVTVLEREMYTEAEAARLLNVAQGTLHYWLEGGTSRRKAYKPVLRTEPTGKRTVTWAEFVEAGLLRQYRRHHKVPMAELRAFIDRMREDLGVPYPLADRRPYVVNKDLVLKAQVSSGLDPEFHLVAAISGQLVLTPPSQNFFDRVDWEGDQAAGWLPIAEEGSTVRIRPDVRFGRPAVKGISTAAIWEQEDAGEDVEDLAALYSLTVADVRWALAYENAERAKNSRTA